MKKRLKKRVTTMLVATMIVSGGAVYAAPSLDAVPSTGQKSLIDSAAIPYTININSKDASSNGYLSKDSEQIMLPVREVSEMLGFEIIWDPKNKTAELSHPQFPIWTLVHVDKDMYTVNRMLKSLGAASVIRDNKLYAPSNFFSDVLRADVSIIGAQVTIVSQAEEKKSVSRNGIITAIHREEAYKSIHIDGAGTDGVILNIDESTIIRNSDGERIELNELSLGMDIQIVHSLAMTMSLPGQTYAYEITAQSSSEADEYIGTSGLIQEVQVDEEDNMRIVVSGIGMTEGSPAEVILMIQPDSLIVDKDGKVIDRSELSEGAKVLAFYRPALTRSLPPIGQAWKIVYLSQE